MMKPILFASDLNQTYREACWESYQPYLRWPITPRVHAHDQNYRFIPNLLIEWGCTDKYGQLRWFITAVHVGKYIRDNIDKAHWTPG